MLIRDPRMQEIYEKRKREAEQRQQTKPLEVKTEKADEKKQLQPGKARDESFLGALKHTLFPRVHLLSLNFLIVFAMLTLFCVSLSLSGIND